VVQGQHCELHAGREGGAARGSHLQTNDNTGTRAFVTSCVSPRARQWARPCRRRHPQPHPPCCPSNTQHLHDDAKGVQGSGFRVGQEHGRCQAADVVCGAVHQEPTCSRAQTGAAPRAFWGHCAHEVEVPLSPAPPANGKSSQARVALFGLWQTRLMHEKDQSEARAAATYLSWSWPARHASTPYSGFSARLESAADARRIGRVKLRDESQLRVRLGEACFRRRRRRARYVLKGLQSKHGREPCAPRHVQQQ
jgi:hypothetical protein